MGTPEPGPGNPAFSVVIATYDREATLARVLGSLVAQTFADFEVVVVDDGSTDGTRTLVETMGDPRIRYVHQMHAGRSVARNRGAAEARGSWLTFIDSDDEAQPVWLQRMVSALERPEVAIVCCGARIVKRRPGVPSSDHTVLPKDLGPACFHRRGLFLSGTFALRRDLFFEAGGYHDRLEFSENTELGLRLVALVEQRGQAIATIDEPLLIYYNQRPLAPPEQAEEYLHSARIVLERHGEHYRVHDPRGYARNCSVAAVAAARLSLWNEAREHLCRGIGAWPWEPRQYFRMILASVPPLGRMVWSRRREVL